MNADGRCPACLTIAKPATLRRHDGVCKRCFNQPKTERYCFFAFCVFAAFALVTAFVFDADIRVAETAGESIHVHWMIATAYNAFGLLGVRFLFALLIVVPSFISLRSLIRWRRFRRRNDEAKTAQPPEIPDRAN